MPPLPEPEDSWGTMYNREQLHTYAKAYAAPLLARVAELGKDAARLDWLESVDWALMARGGDQLQLWFDLPSNCKPETIRAAIDAALAAHKEQS